MLGKREGALLRASDGISERVAIAELVGSVLGGGKLSSTDGTTECCLVGTLLNSVIGSRWGVRLCTFDGAAECPNASAGVSECFKVGSSLKAMLDAIDGARLGPIKATG